MNNSIIQERIEQKIYLIRGKKVMLDSDLAKLYGVTTKLLNKAVKRNAERFPNDFLYVLSRQEVAILRSQIATSRLQGLENKEVTSLKSQIVISSSQHIEEKELAEFASLKTWGGRRKLVCAFTRR